MGFNRLVHDQDDFIDETSHWNPQQKNAKVPSFAMRQLANE